MKNASGVRGWLLVFCIWVGVIQPLGAIYGITSEWTMAPEHWRTIIIAETILNTGFAAAAIYVGFALWRVGPHAVLLAKYLLLAAIVFQLAAPVMLLSIMTFGALLDSFPERGPNIAARIAINAVWLIYLHRSARVRMTYSGDRQPSITGTFS